MHLALRLLAALAFVAAAPGVSANPTSERDAKADALAGEFFGLRVDPSKTIRVGELTLQRDVGVLQLAGGTVYFCTPVGGRSIAAVYVGNGTFRYRPPITVEREHLKRFYENEEIVEPFSSAMLLFGDRTLEQLTASATPAAGASDEATTAIEETLRLIADAESRTIPSEFARALLNGDTNDLFLCRIAGRDRGEMLFAIDPYEAEEVSFMRVVSGRAGRADVDVICRTHRQDEYMAPLDHQPARQLAVRSYKLDVDIAENLEVRARAEMQVEATRGAQRWVSFWIAPEVAVDSVTWDGDLVQTVGGRKGSGIVWVRVAGDFPKGATARVAMHYQGKLIRRYVDLLLLEQTNEWYPHHDFQNRATFDVTYRWPANFTLLSSGTRRSQSVDGEVATSHWVQERPSRFASFNLGFFKPMPVQVDSLPPVTIYRHIDEASSLAEQVQWDVTESLRFFATLFGRAPVTEFHVSSYPANHGEAYPGLVHLASGTFSGNSGSGAHEMFRSHEVAHQWWGLGVDPITYHDWWLAEGFSEYSGMMFMQAVLKDQKRFFKTLVDYRRQIIEHRSSLFGKGQEAGPIWLGHRNSTSTTAEDYWLIIYKKGAWVLHMLRTLMLDPNTLSDAKFTAMMRDFYTSGSRDGATTEDFQRIVEKHAGTKMDWFFQQWVYGTAIPTYHFSHTLKKQADGKYLLKCRVETKGVPAEFRSYPMLAIDFGENRILRGRRPVQGPLTEFELLLPAEPEEIVFNDFESVLCTVEEVDWRE